MNLIRRLWRWVLCRGFYGCVLGAEESTPWTVVNCVLQEIDGTQSERLMTMRRNTRRCVHCGKAEERATFQRIMSMPKDMSN